MVLVYPGFLRRTSATQTIYSKRANFEHIIGLEGGPVRVRFVDHKSTQQDEVAGHVVGSQSDFFSILVYDVPKPGETVLVVRDNGYGDVLLTTPLLRSLKAKGAIIDYMTREPLIPLLRGNPNIRNLLPLEHDNGDRSKWDHHINLIRVSEDAEDAGFHGHRIHAFARALDISIETPDMSLDYYMTDKERKFGQGQIDKLRKSSGCSKVVAFGWMTSREERNWSQSKRLSVISSLITAGYAVAVFHSDPAQNLTAHPALFDLTGKLHIRQAAAHMAGCDVALMPDTGLLHLASALDLPTVAYMGAFPPETRCTHKSLEVLNEPESCGLFPCRSYRCWNRAEDRTPMCLDVSTRRTIGAVQKLCPITPQGWLVPVSISDT